MRLTEREADKLLLFVAADVARRRRARGLRLNHPEAVALISAELLEGIRDGRSVAELMSFGATVLGRADVLPGVAELVPEIQIEGTFPDGTKLVTVHDPIRGDDAAAADADRVVPGEVLVDDGEIEINAGRERVRVRVDNEGDRPVQVGSHTHFFEANAALRFDRAAAYGMRLDVPAGTALRFEPGEGREVDLVALGGTRVVHGMNGLVGGALDDEREAALVRARGSGHLPAPSTDGEAP